MLSAVPMNLNEYTDAEVVNVCAGAIIVGNAGGIPEEQGNNEKISFSMHCGIGTNKLPACKSDPWRRVIIS